LRERLVLSFLLKFVAFAFALGKNGGRGRGPGIGGGQKNHHFLEKKKLVKKLFHKINVGEIDNRLHLNTSSKPSDPNPNLSSFF
jgi:hypothetical protein